MKAFNYLYGQIQNKYPCHLYFDELAKLPGVFFYEIEKLSENLSKLKGFVTTQELVGFVYIDNSMDVKKLIEFEEFIKTILFNVVCPLDVSYMSSKIYFDTSHKILKAPTSEITINLKINY